MFRSVAIWGWAKCIVVRRSQEPGGHNLLSDRSIHEDNDLDLACERNLDAQVDDMCWNRIERYIDEINVTSTLEDEDSESLGQMT